MAQTEFFSPSPALLYLWPSSSPLITPIFPVFQNKDLGAMLDASLSKPQLLGTLLASPFISTVFSLKYCKSPTNCFDPSMASLQFIIYKETRNILLKCESEHSTPLFPALTSFLLRKKPSLDCGSPGPAACFPFPLKCSLQSHPPCLRQLLRPL